MRQKVYFYLNWVLISVLTVMILVILTNNILYPGPDASYWSWGISDYLINYQGGFIRRGLIGEILYQIYTIKQYDVALVIMVIDVVSFIVFFAILAIDFAKRNWSMLPLLFPFVCVNWTIYNYRRDFLMQIIVYVIYSLLFKYWKTQQIRPLVFSIALLTVALLIYEPVFFITVPILCLLFYYQQSESNLIYKRILKTATVFALPLITIGILFFYKGGDADTPNKIWSSWHSLFLTFPCEYPMEISCPGQGVDYLNNTLLSSVKHTVTMLFRLNESIKHILYSGFLLCISFPMIYFVVTRTPSYNLKTKTLTQNNCEMQFSNIFVIQVLAMMPMFGILSCDFGRTMPYCIYTTFMIVHLSIKYNVNLRYPESLDRFSSRIQHFINRQKTLSSFPFYLLVLFFVPLRGCYGPEVRDTLIYNIFLFIRNKVLSIIQ